MKIGVSILCVFIFIVFTGCYKQIPIKEERVAVDFKVVAIDESPPSKDEADIIIITHIKKVSYLFSPRTAETPYTFTILIDGSELKESLEGVEEVESKIAEERGKGIHYTLRKRIRLKSGSYVIVLKPEDGPSAKVKIELSDGKIHTLMFDPVYGPHKFGRPRHFREGVVDYRVYLDDNEILK